jgi:hypothetical protein
MRQESLSNCAKGYYMKSNFPSNGSWPRDLDDFAARIERVQKGYAQWRKKQARGTDRVEAKSSEMSRLRGVLAWLKKFVVGK